MAEVKCACANGALLQAPAFENHARGTNWLAVIDIDGTMPGGLSRRWIERGKGACIYLVEKIGLFDAVEFGADYMTGTGAKKPRRWYGVVIAKTEDHLALEPAPSGKDAVLLSKLKRASPKALAAALLAERKALLDRADKLLQDADAIEKGASFESFDDFAKRLIETL